MSKKSIVSTSKFLNPVFRLCPVFSCAFLFQGGVIGGVQNAINSAVDTIKFFLVIVLPQTETFGWLIMASYASICLGTVFYMTYACKHGETSLETNEPNKMIFITNEAKNDTNEKNGSPAAVALL